MEIKHEIIIYLLIAALLSALRRVISGAKNGCFYAKGNTPYPKLLEKWIKNIHYLESPAWYTQFGSQFFLSLALYRTFYYGNDVWSYLLPILGALMTSMGTSAIAGVFYQGYINVSDGKKFVDDTENPKSEFAFGPIHFWWKRPWYGKGRIYASILGLITMLLGIYIGTYY